MPPSLKNDRKLRSGPFLLDLDDRRLTRDGAPVPLNGLPLAILTLLLGAGGRLVTRAELKRALWPHAVRIDTERRLNTALRALRGTLGDEGRQPRFIETVRGHGYRWIGGAAPARRQGSARLAAALALALLVGESTVADGGAGRISAEQEARFVALASAAQSNRGASADALGRLVRRHPDYAPARILQAQLAAADWRERPDRASLARAEAALGAARAVAGRDARLEELSAELALGGRWDWRVAEFHYRRALAIDPSSEAARQGMAWLHVNRGEGRLALPELGWLLAAGRPTDDQRADLGWLLLRGGRPELALALCRADAGTHLNLLSCRHTALAQTGAIAPARAVAVTLLAQLGADPAFISLVRDAAPAAGYRHFLLWRVAHFPPARTSWFQRAQLQAEAGQFDAALASLERAVAARDPLAIKMRSTPAFARLAGSARYRALLRAVGSA
jgi:DNA-binding winged helix-turn-helix (wHTH) protein